MTLHTARRLGATKRPPPQVADPRPHSASAQTTNDASASRLRRHRRPIVIGLAIVLAWGVITQSLVAYLSDGYPEIAYWLHATPTVLLNLADDKLNADAAKKLIEPVLSPNFEHASRERSYAKGIQSIEKLAAQAAEKSTENAQPAPPARAEDNLSEADYAEIKSWAQRALRNDPLNARALRILAQIAEHESDLGHTKVLMQGAAQRSLQESLAIFWMMRQKYRDQEYAEAIRYADILLRTRPQLSDHIFPMLGRIAEIPVAKGELTSALGKDPPWRGQFFNSLSRNVTDARTPLEVLLSLRDAATPPTDAERQAYLQALIEHKLYELAYYSWLQFLPPDQLSSTGRLFNGSFEVPPSGLPFDWVFKKAPGVNVKFAPRPDREREQALLIEFGPGRVDFGAGVSELVLLPPGNYRLEGKYKADLVSQRGLQWSVRCADATTPIGLSTTMNGSSPTWQDIDFTFSVPDRDCPAQRVTLALDARSASEQFVSGAVWYDDLAIARIEEAEPSPGEPTEPVLPQ